MARASLQRRLEVTVLQVVVTNGSMVSQRGENLTESAPMHRIDKLSTAQRVVVVVAIGAAFLAVGSYLQGLGQHGFAFGWTGYAPLSVPNAGRPGWVSLVVWLALTCLWAVVSIRLLRPSRRDEYH